LGILGDDVLFLTSALNN